MHKLTWAFAFWCDMDILYEKLTPHPFSWRRYSRGDFGGWEKVEKFSGVRELLIIVQCIAICWCNIAPTPLKKRYCASWTLAGSFYAIKPHLCPKAFHFFFQTNIIPLKEYFWQTRDVWHEIEGHSVLPHRDDILLKTHFSPLLHSKGKRLSFTGNHMKCRINDRFFSVGRFSHKIREIEKKAQVRWGNKNGETEGKTLKIHKIGTFTPCT